MSKYHVNPETCRPNLCRAKTPESCLYYNNETGVEAPHFNSKEEARAYVEGEMNKELGETTSLSKKSFKNETENIFKGMPEEDVEYIKDIVNTIKEDLQKVEEKYYSTGLDENMGFDDDYYSNHMKVSLFRKNRVKDVQKLGESVYVLAHELMGQDSKNFDNEFGYFLSKKHEYESVIVNLTADLNRLSRKFKKVDEMQENAYLAYRIKGDSKSEALWLKATKMRDDLTQQIEYDKRDLKYYKQELKKETDGINKFYSEKIAAKYKQALELVGVEFNSEKDVNVIAENLKKINPELSKNKKIVATLQPALQFLPRNLSKNVSNFYVSSLSSLKEKGYRDDGGKTAGCFISKEQYASVFDRSPNGIASSVFSTEMLQRGGVFLNSSANTTLHEFSHTLENDHKYITRLERDFLYSIKNEAEQTPGKVKSRSLLKDYSGELYANVNYDNDKHFYEVFTTGMEGLFNFKNEKTYSFNSAKRFDRDPEPHRNLILGILTLGKLAK